mmetsp:Transcript_16332/g.38652  ORF Transcript_16332/g.38652 Transcript_16332/m.38652 type:complete len:102 (-) Transcript_16332:652-957(-)
MSSEKVAEPVALDHNTTCKVKHLKKSINPSSCSNFGKSVQQRLRNGQTRTGRRQDCHQVLPGWTATSAFLRQTSSEPLCVLSEVAAAWQASPPATFFVGTP